MVRQTGIFSQVVSLFNKNDFARTVKKNTVLKSTRKDSPAGIILYPCFFANLVRLKALEKFVMSFAPVQGN